MLKYNTHKHHVSSILIFVCYDFKCSKSFPYHFHEAVMQCIWPGRCFLWCVRVCVCARACVRYVCALAHVCVVCFVCTLHNHTRNFTFITFCTEVSFVCVTTLLYNCMTIYAQFVNWLRELTYSSVCYFSVFIEEGHSENNSAKWQYLQFCWYKF
jgi:hypothetical protein